MPNPADLRNEDSTLSTSELSQVSQYWAQHHNHFSSLQHWTEVPEVKARINTKISGQPNVDVFGYIARQYYATHGQYPENCLSLGCGAGEMERGLTQYFLPKKHTAIDISAELVNVARKAASAFPHIQYLQADLNTYEFDEHSYDLVIAHQALHHILNLEGLFERVSRAMRPAAVFVFDEYVGPNRFQWTDRQVECINGIIQTLPAWLNRNVQTGFPQPPMFRCTPAQVIELDPSEAIRSADIIPLAKKYFQLAEFLPYGGTILHMLLHMRAGNFLHEQAKPWLHMLFNFEDLLLPELGSDFAAAICTLPDRPLA